MNILEIYETIKTWERDAGESFLDQGFNLNEMSYMLWCLGRGYITPKQFNLWQEAYANTQLEAIDANYYVYNGHGEDVPWAIISSEEWNEGDHFKAYMILSEFISEISVYQDRLNKFVEGIEE